MYYLCSASKDAVQLCSYLSSFLLCSVLSSSSFPPGVWVLDFKFDCKISVLSIFTFLYSICYVRVIMITMNNEIKLVIICDDFNLLFTLN